MVGPIEYDWTVSPGADASQIRVAFTGADSVQLDAQGNLVLGTASGTVTQQAPVVYQLAIDGTHQSVAGQFVINADGTVGVALGNYDHSRALVIDPQITLSTFIGGSSLDKVNAVAVDGSGNIYVAGTTQSTNFPTSTGSAFHNSEDAFVAKFSASGALQYSTVFGGSFTEGEGVAVDGSGNAYVAGVVSGGNLPTTSNAYQSAPFSPPGDFAHWVTEFDTTGKLTYGTYLGGATTTNVEGRLYLFPPTQPTLAAVALTSTSFQATVSGADGGTTNTIYYQQVGSATVTTPRT